MYRQNEDIILNVLVV